MQTENSNKTSPNENISSLPAPRLLFLLCAVGTSWVAEVPGGAGSPGRGDAAQERWWPGGKGCGWPGPGGLWGHWGVKGGSRRGLCWWRCEPDTNQHRSLLLLSCPHLGGLSPLLLSPELPPRVLATSITRGRTGRCLCPHCPSVPHPLCTEPQQLPAFLFPLLLVLLKSQQKSILKAWWGVLLKRLNCLEMLVLYDLYCGNATKP